MKNTYLAIIVSTLLISSALFSGCAVNRQILSTEVLSNTTYTGIYDFPITLNNGRWEGEPFIKGIPSHRPTVWLDEDIYLKAYADDGSLDIVAVILWENSGGTGIHSYLAVMDLQASKMVNLATVYIGDRTQIQNGKIDNGEIELNVVQHGEDDGLCCPTHKATLRWDLKDLLNK